jgi:hypothetical protein
MKTYSFTLTLGGVDLLTPEMGDALERAGCDDATMSSRDGVVSIAFDRESDSLGKAIGSAVEDIERAGYRVAAVHVESPLAAV